MKRWLKYVVLLVAAAVLIVGLWAPSYAITKDGKYKFVYCTGGTSSAYYRPTLKGLEEAGKMFDVEWEFVGPVENDIPKIVTATEAVISDPEVDGIICLIYDPISHDEVIQTAIDRGIAVVSANADDEDTPNARMAYIGDTSYGQGRFAGKKLLELLGEGPGKVAIFMWGPQIQLKDRARGIADIIEPHGWLVDETSAGVTDVTIIAGMIESYYRAHPDCVAIVGCDGQSTPATGIAIRKIGKGKAIGAGFDLVAATLDAIDDGYMDFTFDQMPYKYGFYSIAVLYHYLKYDMYPSDVVTKGSIVDASNVVEVMKLMEKGYR